MTKEYCINCQTELNCLDEDPNGDQNCICAKCRAEENHDFDLEPNVVFERDGSMREEPVTKEGSTFDSEENMKRFVRARQLFDLITAGSYYGIEFRQILATDPEAMEAAKKLVERLAAYKCQGISPI